MNTLTRTFRDFFVSLQLTVALLILSLVLVFVATLDQVNLGIWAVQEKYFRSFFVLGHVPGSSVTFPIFPGGYFIGGMLLINLLAAHIYRFQLTWKKLGIQLAHSGVILLSCWRRPVSNSPMRSRMTPACASWMPSFFHVS